MSSRARQLAAGAIVLALGCAPDGNAGSPSGSGGAGGSLVAVGVKVIVGPTLGAPPGTQVSGSAGAGGSGGSGTGGGSGAASGAGSGGSGGTTCTPPPTTDPSTVCGDGLRDTVTEECDDGNTDDTDGCASCIVVDRLAVAPVPPSSPSAPPLGRRLGNGRHPVASSNTGAVVAFVDETTFDVGVSIFSPYGVRTSTVPSVSKGLQASNPVVGALDNCGGYVLSWTDFDGDGDELGIAVAKLDASGTIVGKVHHANTTTAFSQHDSDLLVTSNGIVVSWVDDSDPVTAPDLRYTILGSSLSPAGESTLAATDDVEGNVSLAAFGSSWAAAWRTGQGYTESIMVRSMGTPGVSWVVSGVTAPFAEETPALVELDSTHLFLVYNEGVDGAGIGITNDTIVRGRVLDVGAPGTDTGTPCDPVTSSFTVDHPSLVRVGSRSYLAWRWTIPSGTTFNAYGMPEEGEDVLIAELTWQAGDECPTLGTPMPLPRTAAHDASEQRHPAIAASPLGPEGAIFAAWDDLGTSYPGKGSADVVVDLIPSPIVRLPGVEL